MCSERLWVRDDHVTVNHVRRWVSVYFSLVGEGKENESEMESKRWEWVTFLKSNATRVVGHVRCTWIGRKTEENRHQSTKPHTERQIERQKKDVHQQMKWLIVCHAVTKMSENASVWHRPSPSSCRLSQWGGRAWEAICSDWVVASRYSREWWSGDTGQTTDDLDWS